MKNKYKLVCTLFAILSVVFFSKNAIAEDTRKSAGFSMNPFFQEITLNKDQDRAGFVLEISNNTSSPAVFNLSVIDFGAMDESGGVAFLGSSEDLMNKYSLASWVSLQKDAIVLNPGETQSVDIFIENKESLSPGGHYAAILAKLENESADSAENKLEIALQPSFASLIFARKVGGEIQSLALKDVERDNTMISLAEKIQLRFQNTGNVHIAPRGTVKIIDPLGREISNGVINNESALILPETFRIYNVLLKKTALAIIPGKYRISIAYRYDGNDDFFIKEEYVDFFPMSAILVGLSIIGLTMVYGVHRLRKKQRNARRIGQKSFKQKA